MLLTENQSEGHCYCIKKIDDGEAQGEEHNVSGAGNRQEWTRLEGDLGRQPL